SCLSGAVRGVRANPAEICVQPGALARDRRGARAGTLSVTLATSSQVAALTFPALVSLRCAPQSHRELSPLAPGRERSEPGGRVFGLRTGRAAFPGRLG